MKTMKKFYIQPTTDVILSCLPKLLADSVPRGYAIDNYDADPDDIIDIYDDDTGDDEFLDLD